MSKTIGTANIKLRGRIEGIEFEDISSVSIRSGVGQPAVATVVVPAVDEASNLLPRTLVEISYSLDGNSFYHLFAGELQSIQYTEQASSTQVVLQLVDMTTYWDAAKHYYARDDELLPSEITRVAAFMGTDKSEYMPIIESAGWSVVKAFRKEPASMPGLRGLMGGIIHVLERIGGVYKGPRKFGGLNTFFNQAELRLRLTQRIWASSKDDTSVRMFKHYSFNRWVRRTVQSNSGMASFRDIITGVLGLIYHNYVPIIAPRFIAGGKVIHIPGVPPSPKRSAKVPEAVKAFVRRRIAALESIIGILDDIRDYAAQKEGITDDFVRKSTRAQRAFVVYERELRKDAKGAVIDPLIKQLDETNNLHVASNIFGSTTSYTRNGPPDAGAMPAEMGAASTGGFAFRKYTPTQGSGVSESGYVLNYPLFYKMMSALFKALSRYRSVLNEKGGSSGRAPRDVKVVDRLVETVFLPDIFFTAPPLCNVIFPDQRASQTMARSYLKEITRLRLTTKESWGMVMDELLAADPLMMSKKMAVAPNLTDVHGEKTLSDAKRGARIILPHEIFTGIIPDFKKLPYLNVFVGKDDDETAYMQRSAEYLFIKGRMAGRNISIVALTFLPQIVAGMPGLVVGTDSEKKHKLGMITGVMHNIAAGGAASTAISMTDARFHDETYDGPAIKKEVVDPNPNYGTGFEGEIKRAANDLLGDTKGILTYYSKKSDIIKQAPEFNGLAAYSGFVANVSNKTGVLFNMFSKRLAALVGEQHKDERTVVSVLVSNFGDVASNYLTIRSESGRIVNSLKLEFKGLQKVNLDDASRQARSEFAISRQMEALIGKLSATHRLLTNIVGKKGKRVKRTVVPQSGPLEDFLRPSWISPIYERDNVGESFYKECLGVGSIMDAFPGNSIKESVDSLVGAYRDSVSAKTVWEFIEGLTSRPVATEDEVAKFHENAVWRPDAGASFNVPILGSVGEISLPYGIVLPSGTRDRGAYDPAADPRQARYIRAKALVDALKKGVAR